MITKQQQTEILTLPLFHVSADPNLHWLYPRLPKQLTTTEAQNAMLEDLKTPRICFAETIEGCILGIQINQNQVFIIPKVNYVDWYVHSPLNLTVSDTVSNIELIKQLKVFDAHITGEWWVINPVQVKKLYKIRIYRSTEQDKPIVYLPFDGKVIVDKRYLNKEGKIENYQLKYEIKKQY